MTKIIQPMQLYAPHVLRNYNYVIEQNPFQHKKLFGVQILLFQLRTPGIDNRTNSPHRNHLINDKTPIMYTCNVIVPYCSVLKKLREWVLLLSPLHWELDKDFFWSFLLPFVLENNQHIIGIPLEMLRGVDTQSDVEDALHLQHMIAPVSSHY